MADSSEDHHMAYDSPADHNTAEDSPGDQQPTTTPVRRSPRIAARRVTTSPQAREEPPRSQVARKTGRTQHMIWVYFEKFTDWSSKPHAECNYCQVAICSAQPGTNMQFKELSPMPCCCSTAGPRLFPGATSRGGFHRSGADGSASGGYTQSITGGDAAQLAPTPTQQQKFEMQLASMFYLCALPFALDEPKAFGSRSSFSPQGIRFPSRHRLSGELLRRTRDQIHTKAVALIRQQRFVTIVTDAWTNVNHSQGLRN